MFSSNDRTSFSRYIKEYFIYFLPVVYLVYLVLESYQFDFRSFYIAGKSVLYHLDPYINYVSDFPELFGPVNSESAPTSGFRYPPFAAIVFMPLGLVSYSASKLIFSCLMIFLLCLTFFHLVRNSELKIKGEAILFVMVSFPVLASFERGQVDILVLYLTLLAFLTYYKNKGLGLSALMLAIAGCIKIFPLVTLIYFLFKREFKFVLYTSIYTAILFVLPLIYFNYSVYQNFFQRFLPSIFGEITSSQPISLHGQGVVNNMVNSVDSNGLTLTHAFTNGFMNPLLQSNPLGAVITGLIAISFLLLLAQNHKPDYQFFAILNTINIFNPLAWIMGLVWYIPLFLHLYGKVNNFGRFLILLPLFMPPFTNTNAILAYLISLVFCLAFENPSVSRWLLAPNLTS